MRLPADISKEMGGCTFATAINNKAIHSVKTSSTFTQNKRVTCTCKMILKS
jgi:hypothetical protein